MYDLERFSELLRRDFVPLVYAQGFEACGSVFRRVSGKRIDVVSLQGSRRDRKCCVNLGVHYCFLPLSGRPERVHPADYSSLRGHDCLIRERLREPGDSDRWWSYGSDDATAEASVASLVDVYARWAHLFFERYGSEG
jgi:hypothetical protein